MSGVLGGLARAAVALALGVPLAGCITSIGAWTYPSGRYPTTACEQPAAAIVAVERFADARDETNRSFMPWAYVPLSPGGWTHFDRPEATIPGQDTTRYRASPCEDLARSIVAELTRERMVERAEYVADAHLEEVATHVLRGTIRTYYVHESRWTYGISIYAQILWCLALPMGTSRNGFCVDLELLERKSGRIAWSATLYDADFHVEGLYYGPEWYRFSWMWERRLREKLGEVATALGTTGAPLPRSLAEELESEPPRLPSCMGIDSKSPCKER